MFGRPKVSFVPNLHNKEVGTMMVTCVSCKCQTAVMNIPAVDFNGWIGGQLIQQSFPYLSLSQREAFISGICETCQPRFFGTDEEDL